MFNGVYNDNDASCQQASVLVTIQSAPKGEKNVRPILYQIVLLQGIKNFFKRMIFWSSWLTNCEVNRALIHYNSELLETAK